MQQISNWVVLAAVIGASVGVLIAAVVGLWLLRRWWRKDTELMERWAESMDSRRAGK